MNELGKLILNGSDISYPDFFKAYGYGMEDQIYIRVFYDDIEDKKQYAAEFQKKHGRKPKQNEQFNPLKTKFNKTCKVKDFDKFCMRELFALNVNNYGVYFVVNGGGCDSNAVKKNSIPRAQFMEIDDQSFDEQMRIIKEFPLEPSIMNRTKKSIHCYWLLSDGDFVTWKKVQKRLIAKFKSDPKISDESRVMRLPGFFHRKDKNNPVMCTLIKFDPDRRYSQNDLLNVLPEVENENSSGDSDISEGLLENIEQAGGEKFLKMCEYVERLLTDNSIPFNKRPHVLNDGSQIMAFYLTDESFIPWHDEYETPWKPEDTLIFVRLNGMICLSGRHKHDETHGWKDFILSYKPPDQIDSGWKEHKASREPPKEFEIKLVSGRELQKKDVPPIVYPVENIIPQGYTVASAPFKFGKSWLALEMCLAVAEGADFLGQHTTKGSTVYFALEDCDQFAKERLNMVLNGREAPEGFYYIYEDVPTLDDGLIGYLNQLYKTVPDLKMVVIDILAKVEYQPMRNESAYKCDYRTGGALKKWADDHLVSLISITHTTKMVHPNDVFMNTTGSSAVSGSADALITIAKEKRTSKEATLAITGRRVREKYFKVHLRDGYIWETDGEVDPETMEIDQAKREQEERLAEYMDSPIREALIQIADAGIERDLSSREIIDTARDKEIYLHETAAEVGLFIHKFQNYLFTEDRVKTYIRKRGTGSNLYRLAIWEPAEEETDETFTE